MLYADTDSLLVSIKTEDVNKDMASSADEYNFSDYQKAIHYMVKRTKK